MQLTWASAYDAYGDFTAQPTNSGAYVGESRITQTSTHYWDDPTKRDAHGHIIGIIGTRKQWAPRFNPNILATNSHAGCDSGGFFWIWKHHDHTRNISRVADLGFLDTTIDRVNKLVNGGSFGYFERFAFSWYTRNIFTDWIPENMEFTTPTPKHIFVRVNLSRPE